MKKTKRTRTLSLFTFMLLISVQSSLIGMMRSDEYVREIFNLMHTGILSQMMSEDNDKWLDKRQDVVICMIKELLRCGFGVNNIYGRQPYGYGANKTLLSVSSEGLPKVVKYLINEAGADIDLKTSSNSHSKPEAPLMITFNEILSCNSKCLKKELLEILSFFIKKKGVDYIIDQGQTLLHKACLSASGETIKLLLENGARLDIADDKGKKPYDYDYHSKLSDIAEELGIEQEPTIERVQISDKDDLEFVILSNVEAKNDS